MKTMIMATLNLPNWCQIFYLIWLTHVAISTCAHIKIVFKKRLVELNCVYFFTGKNLYINQKGNFERQKFGP